MGMLVVANIGKFISEYAPSFFKQMGILASTIYGSNVEKLKKEKPQDNISNLGLMVIFTGFVIFGALVIPLWEDLKFSDAIYFM